MSKDTKGNYASVNGLEMYYEVHGAGRPLVLLHGGPTTIDVSFSSVLPSFAKSRQVIAVEQQGHGHTADVDRPMSLEQKRRCRLDPASGPRRGPGRGRCSRSC